MFWSLITKYDYISYVHVVLIMKCSYTYYVQVGAWLKLTRVFILLYYIIMFKLYIYIYIYDVQVCAWLMLTHVFILLYYHEFLLHFLCAGWRSADANVCIMLN
jgi:hypothetical protein